MKPSGFRSPGTGGRAEPSMAEFTRRVLIVTGLAFSADGRELVSVDRNRDVRTWQTSDGKVLADANGGAGYAASLAVAPNGGKVAWNVGLKADVVVRDVPTGKDTSVTWNGTTPLALALSADGGMLAAGDRTAKGELTIWNTTDAKQLAILDTGAVHAHALTFSPDDKLVAAACSGGVILWDWKAGTSRRVLDTDGMTTSAVAFSPNGKLLAAATSTPLAPRDAVVRVWDVEEKRVRSEWRGVGQQVTHLAFSPDGRRLATVGTTSSQQGLLKLWDTTGGREVFSAALPPAMVTAVAFGPDGRRLAAATHAADATAAQSGRKIPGVIHVWDATADAVRP